MMETPTMGEDLDIILTQFPINPDDPLDASYLHKTFANDIILSNKGHLIIVDSEAGRLRVFDQDGLHLWDAGSQHLSSAWSILQTNSGKIVVSDPVSHDLKVFSKSGRYLTNSEHGNHLIEPCGIAYHPETAKVAVCDKGASCVYIHGADGKVQDILRVKSSEEVPEMRCPSYVAFARNGCCMVTDMESNCLFCFDEEGDLKWTFGDRPENHSLPCPCGVSVDSEGNTLVADSENSRVVMVGPAGQYLGYALTWADGLAEPRALKVDRTRLYLTEAASGFVKVFDYEKLKARKHKSEDNDDHF